MKLGTIFNKKDSLETSFEQEYSNVVKRVNDLGYYPNVPIVKSAATETRIVINNDSYYLFASNNYFGMSYNDEVKAAIVSAVEKYGMGSGGPRLLSGNIDVHNELESSIANFLNREACITFTTGYMANIGIIPALLNTSMPLSVGEVLLNAFSHGRDVAVFSDEFCHGSIVDGVRLAKVEKHIFKHKDMNSLEYEIKKSKASKKLIITDGIFSMEGDLAPMKEIVEIAKDNNCLLMVDDAHGIGVIGSEGRGILEHFNLSNDDVPILLGTFTKAFGGIGGFVVGTKDLIDYLKIKARTYLLSAPIPPAIAAGLIKAVEIVKHGHELREKAFNNARYFEQQATKMGYKILGDTESLISPLLVGDEKKAINFTKDFLRKRIYVPNVRFPAVPIGKSRLRFVFSSLHQKSDIDYLLKCLYELRGEYVQKK